ncbi:MAG: arylsulfatase [Chitinophagales bacterium]|nr:arylsulfatase [Bacteroidota bacterium]MBP7399417.1 arylsulfatase [Chitinophagales bacterium]MBK8682616.1 arylsulfatase [Bacteroidota bacterium]MBP8754013.1 arylsulfatase [Chitinophagales bacterium]MBP9188061.1 arylsulfatase [Chitinophagales bacterium]
MKVSMFALLGMFILTSFITNAQEKGKNDGKKPNIILLISDDTGWGDLGLYGGGEGRGMPTPNLDKIGNEGMQFWSFYGQPSCTPGRAAMQTGRIPNRSGMTTVAFQGQGGGLPAAEYTIADILKQGGYTTYFSGKWHLGEADYAMPTAHGYDKMQNVVLYHLNAYTYAFPSWNPDMSAETSAFFKKVTTGILEGEGGKPVREISKVTEENIAELDMMMTDNVLKQLDEYAAGDEPFYMNINFAKNHQPNLPSKQFKGKSPAKSDYGDCVMEMDYNTGRIMDKLKELGIDENTIVVYTVDNGAWQDVHPDAGYTPFRGSKGNDREGGSRVPALAWWPGHIEAGSKNHDIVGGLDLMATFASLAGVALPTKDKEGQPMVFDSYDMSNILFNEGKPLRDTWFYFTENELAPGAVRIGKWKAVFNTRGDNGAMAGSDMPGQQLGWRGDQTYVATVPAIYDIWQDPQERYDLFMNSFTEKTWTIVIFNKAIQDLINTYIQYPPRQLQSEVYTGPMGITQFRTMEEAKKLMEQKGIKLPDLNSKE